MRHYEVVAVIHPDQQGRIAAMIEIYKKIVADGGGILHRLEDWGRRPLAYPIQNQHKAQYLLMNIECGGDTLDKLRETFRFSDSIIRSLIVRRERAITEPSIVMLQEKKDEGGEENSSAEADAKPASSESEGGGGAAKDAPAAESESSSASSASSQSESEKSEKSEKSGKSEKTRDASADDAQKTAAAAGEDSAAAADSSQAESSESSPPEKGESEKENDK